MNLDEVQLETIRKAGTLLIPPSLVAINLEVDELDFRVFGAALGNKSSHYQIRSQRQ